MSDPAVKIPSLNSLRFHKVGTGDFWQNSIPFMEAQNARYCQKMSVGDLFVLQISIKDYDLHTGVYKPVCQLVDDEGTVVQSFAVKQPVTIPYIGAYYHLYFSDNLDNHADGVYYCKLTVYYPINEDLGDWASMVFYSEPIYIRTHTNTVVIRYGHTTNDFDCIFTDAPVPDFALRIEGGIKSEGFTPGGKFQVFTDLDYEPVMLQGNAWTVYKWTFGPGEGMPNYMADKLNRLFACDTVTIDGVGWMRNEGAKLEPTREQGYPSAGWSIELLKVESETSEGFDLDPFTVDIDTVTSDSTLITCDKTLT